MLKKEGGLRTRGQYKKKLSGKPLITIITVVYNDVNNLEKTINSVIGISYDNIEYLIIDGGSNDGTLDIIKKYEYYIGYWISEKDNGIYDAMNKGWSLADRESYILYLGSGDTLLTLPSLSSFDDKSVVYGDVSIGSEYEHISKISSMTRICNTIHHQAMMVPKQVSIDPPFITKYRMYADFDFNQRMIINKVNFIRDDNFRAYAEPGGVTAKTNSWELASVSYKNYGLLYFILSLVYTFVYLRIKNYLIKLLKFVSLLYISI